MHLELKFAILFALGGGMSAVCMLNSACEKTIPCGKPVTL